jgi:5'-nucleotidase
MNAARQGKWMQTFTGLAYWPVDPRAEDVCIEDIAHALANICRYGGHCRRFYSVAEHSIHVSRIVPPGDALAGLLHDAAEAYCADVPRPLKKMLNGYAEIEAVNWRVISTRFGVAEQLSQSVHDADIAMLFAEQKVLLGPSPRPDWGMGLNSPLVADVGIRCWTPAVAERRFIQRFKELIPL